MACTEWKEIWVARIYDELEPAEERAMSDHLSGCERCRETMDQLSASRLALQDAAPVVPATPRTVVLQPRRLWPVAWGFAAGIACAALVFVLGIQAAPRFTGQDDASAETARPGGDHVVEAAMPARDSEARDGIVEALQADLRRLRDRVDDMEHQAEEPRNAVLHPQALPRDQFQEELVRLERRVSRERANDVEFLIRSINATEMRTGNWMNRTQEALQYLALKQDPMIREH